MNPYQKLAEKCFWAPAVARKNMFDINGLWEPKFLLGKQHKVITFGSCFAQHIGRALVSNGYSWLNTELPPYGLSEANAKTYNYGVFSSRTGNIYTVSLLNQWVSWASGRSVPPDEIWSQDDRFFDPFRPNIEPNGFRSQSELLLSRELAISLFSTALKEADLFVFTLGLTESWVNKKAGYEYPMCPGTVAGEFSEADHQFINQNYPTIGKILNETILLIRELNPDIQFLLTVSPVPLTATMSGKHVLVATMESKSVLRAVAGQISSMHDFVDYFPSYEIINGTPYRGVFFESNQRGVNLAGVNHVMKCFFSCLNAKFSSTESAPSVVINSKAGTSSKDEIVCEEELLGAFSVSEVTES